MKIDHFTSPRGAHLPPSKRSLLKEVRGGASARKQVQAFTRRELAALFGVRISEVAMLARMGVFQRIGADRYLLDCSRSAMLLSKSERPALPGAGLRTRHPDLSMAMRQRSGLGSAECDIVQPVAEFYRRHDGFLENSVNIVNVPDLQHATMMAGIFLEDGLRGGERVAVLSFEHPDKLFARFAEAGILFDEDLETEQLAYLYYKPDVAHSISLSVDYRELFSEVMRLGGEDVRRLVLFNVDSLINANSEHLVYSSLHQMIYAANHFHVTLLGLFVASGQVAALIDEGCRAILPGYYVMD